MSDKVDDATYTMRRIEDMLGLGRSVVTGLINAGFVTPVRGARNEYRFTFQDVVLLRTAYQLRAAKVAPRRMMQSLQALRAKLPAALPLSGLRIKAIGHDVAVRGADEQWEAGSGQLLMDFEVTGATTGAVRFLQRDAAPAPAPAITADDWFHRGEQLESDDPLAAEAAYRQAVALAPGHAHAFANLGAMLCESGRSSEALELLDLGLAGSPDATLLHFNRAIALEDLHRLPEALAAYDRCLQLDPDLADAHYNAARLHERAGDPQGALRHYSAYRRLAT